MITLITLAVTLALAPIALALPFWARSPRASEYDTAVQRWREAVAKPQRVTVLPPRSGPCPDGDHVAKDADYYTQQWIDAVRATIGDAFMHLDSITDDATGEQVPVDIEIHTDDLEWVIRLWKDSFVFDQRLRDAGVNVRAGARPSPDST